MEFKLSMGKDQLTELMATSMGGETVLKSVRVRTTGGKVIDFEELVFIINVPIATK